MVLGAVDFAEGEGEEVQKEEPETVEEEEVHIVAVVAVAVVVVVVPVAVEQVDTAVAQMDSSPWDNNPPEVAAIWRPY